MFKLSRPVQLYPKILGSSFLDRLVKCALELESFEIHDDAGSGSFPGCAVLELDVAEHPRHSQVSVFFSAPEAEVGPVEVNVFADDWSPTLDYKTYTSTVREVLQPLLTCYNRAYGTQLRLGIPGPEKPVQLPAKADKLLQRYLGRTTMTYAHPLDWGTFYDFVIHCHERRVGLLAEELEDLLLAKGMLEGTATKLADVYRHGRSLLRRRISPRFLV